MASQAILFPSSQTMPAAHILDYAPSPAESNGSGSPPPAAANIVDPGVDLARKTVCIKVRLSTIGNTRKVSTSQIEADADKQLLRVSKRLLDSAELKAVARFDGEIRRYLYNMCLPFEVGIHLLPVAALEAVEFQLQRFQTARAELVEAFLAAYPGLCQDAAKRLRGLYNPVDYPAVEEAAKEFSFSWQYVSFGVPDQLKAISSKVWEQERTKAAARMAEASSEVQSVLRESMAKLVDHMAERLKDGPDGKPVRFKESSVSNLLEFLSNFEFRNVTDDRELQALVGRARNLLQGVAVDELRTTGELRSRVQRGMEAISAQLGQLTVKSNGRRFRFDEEPEVSTH